MKKPIIPQRIGIDWKLVRMTSGPLKGKLFAKNPKTGELVRVTQKDIADGVANLIPILGPPPNN